VEPADTARLTQLLKRLEAGENGGRCERSARDLGLDDHAHDLDKVGEGQAGGVGAVDGAVDRRQLPRRGRVAQRAHGGGELADREEAVAVGVVEGKHLIILGDLRQGGAGDARAAVGEERPPCRGAPTTRAGGIGRAQRRRL
jgi:hypothetical protein